MRGMFCGTALISAAVPHSRNEQTDEPAERGEHNTLGQQLPNDTRPARAERRAQRDLLPAHGSAREQKIGHVRIRDQEDADDRAEQNIERGPHVADQVLAQRLHERRRSRLLVSGYCFSEARGDGREIGLRLCDRDARFQARDRLRLWLPRCSSCASSRRDSELLRDRHVNFDRIGLDRELETAPASLRSP